MRLYNADPYDETNGTGLIRHVLIRIPARRQGGDSIRRPGHIRPDGRRRYAMREARETIEKRYGAKVAELLFEVNPERLLKDQTPLELPEFPTWFERLKRRWLGR